MRNIVIAFAGFLTADGLLVLTTGKTFGGETIHNRLSNGLGLIGVGLGALVLYEAVRWAYRHRTRDRSS